MQGRLIAFEGLDQSGKQTQAELLAAHLRDRGRQVQLVSFPEYETAIGHEIARALAGERDYGPEVMQLLYVANRYERKPELRRWLEEGRIIVSDRYAALHYSHHFEGFLLNRIPLMRKLKWRLVGTSNVILGGMSSMNKSLIAERPDGDGLTVGFLSRGLPYIELGYGVENIFKFFRVDFIHRLTYLDETKNPDVRRFGVLVSFQFNL